MSSNNSVLDEILADSPSDEAKALPAEPIESTTPEQPRDDGGKFASKAEEPDKAKEPTRPHDGETDVIPEPLPEGGEADKTVPIAALHAERNKTKELNGQVSDLSRQVQQLVGQVQMLNQRPAPSGPKEEPAAKGEWWDDPEGFNANQTRELLTPVQQELQQLKVAYSHRGAVQEFGAENVAAATEALKSAVTGGALDGNQVQQRLSASMDPIGDVVRWHRQAQNRERVGDDPDKWLQSELDKRMSDPAFQAEVIKRVQGGGQRAGGNSGQAAPVVLPPSLNRIPGGANAAAGDRAGLSIEAMFNEP